MRAVILNSGVGRRMGDLTNDRPKCLVELANGDTILDLQMQSVARLSLEPVVITTGPFDQELTRHVERKFPNVEVRYAHNPNYATTNYIYSLHLARALVDDDLILLHGDMVYDESVLDLLVQSPYPNAVLVDPKVPPPEKDFKGRIRDGLVRHIGVDIRGDDCVFLLPMYKLSVALVQDWFKQIGRFVAEGQLNVYAENALNEILNDVNLRPIYLNGQLCMEVDDATDLDRARKLIEGKG